MSRKLFASIASLLCCASVCLAQPTTMPSMSADDTPEQKVVRDAAMDFITLLEKEDLADAKKAFAGTDEDWKLLQIMHETIGAMSKVKAAAEKRFPEEMKNARESDDMSFKGLRRQMSMSPVLLNGEEAMVGRSEDGMAMKKVDGTWKVTALAADPRMRRTVLAAMPLMGDMARQTLTDLEAGKYESFAAMQQAMEQEMKTKIMPIVMREMMNATSQPTTQPAP